MLAGASRLITGYGCRAGRGLRDQDRDNVVQPELLHRPVIRVEAGDQIPGRLPMASSVLLGAGFAKARLGPMHAASHHAEATLHGG